MTSTTRYLVGGPGWSGAGPTAVGTVVLPLSLDDPGGVTCGGRALVTADKGNDPPQNGRGLSQAWVRDRSSTGWPRINLTERRHEDEYRGHRGLHRYRASARSEHWATALSREGPEDPRQGPDQRRGAPARSLREAGRSREPAGGGRSARHHQGPWP